MTPRMIAKAILAGAIAGAGSLATGATDGTLSLAEWLAALSATLVALGAVYGVPNRADPSSTSGDGRP